jgi:hypothetical protein
VATNFMTKAEILAELWTDYRDHEDLSDFIEYNDLGLPLAFALTSQMITLNPIGENMVNETFRLLLSALELTDTGFENLDDLLDAGGIQ